MGWKEKWKEAKIPNLEADIELLKKRRKNTKYFSWYHLIFYIILFLVSIYGIIVVMDGVIVEEPTLQLTTLIVGAGIAINAMLILALKNYISSLDWDRNGKFYDLLIYLKEKEEK